MNKSTHKIAYQGEAGAFSEEAIHRWFGTGVETLPCRTFDDAFGAVANGQAHGAMIPIENSLAGSIYKNYDLLVANQLEIIGEVWLRIVHHLIAAPGTKLSAIRRIYSHPVALSQCENFLKAHSDMEVISEYDTAGAVQKVIKNARPDEAAIAGAKAAAIYGGALLQSGIEDNAANFTRFVLMVPPANAATFRSKSTHSTIKTSIVFKAKNQPGALFKALAAFVLRDIDLAKIESRPVVGSPFEFFFYLDLLGSPNELNVSRALGHLGEMSDEVRVLGSYPTIDARHPLIR